MCIYFFKNYSKDFSHFRGKKVYFECEIFAGFKESTRPQFRNRYQSNIQRDTLFLTLSL